MIPILNANGLLERVYRVIFVERRLPYSWSRKLQDIRYKGPLDSSLKAIGRTRPIPCEVGAGTELHMVTCVRDMDMAVAACRSLLRFKPGVAVVFHGDESIEEQHSTFLQAAVPGARVHLYSEAERVARQNPEVFELRQRIPDRFSLGKGYEKHRRAWALKVFDFHLLARSPKVVVLDSDTLFLKKPDELIDWIQSDGQPAFYSAPYLANLRVPEERYRSVFPGSRVIPRFNGGFFGFNRECLSLELMSDTMRVLFENPDIPVLGDECVWRFSFGQIDSEELPYDAYPLTTHPERSRKLTRNMATVKYVHFILKHKGGFYRQLADQVKEELMAEQS